MYANEKSYLFSPMERSMFRDTIRLHVNTIVDRGGELLVSTMAQNDTQTLHIIDEVRRSLNVIENIVDRLVEDRKGQQK